MLKAREHEWRETTEKHQLLLSYLIHFIALSEWYLLLSSSLQTELPLGHLSSIGKMC